VKDEKSSNETYGSCSQANLDGCKCRYFKTEARKQVSPLSISPRGKKWLTTGNGTQQLEPWALWFTGGILKAAKSEAPSAKSCLSEGVLRGVVIGCLLLL
jgi:hypothetical protein